MRKAYQHQNARDHLTAVGAAIPHDTDDVRLAIKRELFTRGLALPDLAERLGLSYSFVKHRLSPTAGAVKLSPRFLGRIIAKLNITAKVARRLHYLAAVEAGWDVAESTAGHCNFTTKAAAKAACERHQLEQMK